MQQNDRLRSVELMPPNSSWPAQFETEAQALREVLQNRCVVIEHIGSTAIPNIYAKPVIDMLVVVDDLQGIDDFNAQFEALDYACMGEYGIANRRFYWKSPAQSTHQVHLFARGNPQIKRHLAFRDSLRRHPQQAKAYSWIKRYLAQQFPHDPLSYVHGKDSFIRAIDYQAGVARQDQLVAKDDVVLVPYDPNWPKLAQAEIDVIKQCVDLPYVAIEHCGSTSIKGLVAKPLIDLFIAVEDMNQIGEWAAQLAALGYIDWPDNPDKTHARFFKGMPPFGLQRTHHIHIMPMSDNFQQRVAFRDLLRTNTVLREQYHALKQQLAEQFADDREAYTEAKKHYVQSVLERLSR